eukprot:6983066-Ditylum_brightwellii.AAC.1
MIVEMRWRCDQQDGQDGHPISITRSSPSPQLQTTVLGSAIQICHHSAWERYTNAARKHLGVLYKYIKKVLGSAIRRIYHHHSSVCNLHTMRKAPMALYK